MVCAHKHMLRFYEQAHEYYFDPMMRPNAVGKFINHAARGANVALFPPIEARGKGKVFQ